MTDKERRSRKTVDFSVGSSITGSGVLKLSVIEDWLMTVDPANAEELTVIAGEVGAEVLRGGLRYPSETGGWQLGDLDLDEYLARYRDQKLVLIIAPLGQADPETYTCGICGFVYKQYGECPRCKMQIAEEADWLARPRDILDQVAKLLDGDEVV